MAGAQEPGVRGGLEGGRGAAGHVSAAGEVPDRGPAGASGFLLKDACPEEVVAGIQAVATGDAVVAPRLTRRLLDAHAHQVLSPAQPHTDPRLRTLSEREHEVLMAIGKGWTSAEIAERLVLTESTVEKHVGRVLAKIGARDRIEAVITAYDAGLVRPRS